MENLLGGGRRERFFTYTVKCNCVGGPMLLCVCVGSNAVVCVCGLFPGTRNVSSDDLHERCGVHFNGR